MKAPAELRVDAALPVGHVEPMQLRIEADPSIVHENVESAPGAERSLHQLCARLGRRHTALVRLRHAALLADLLDDSSSARVTQLFAVRRTAEIAHQDSRALARECQRRRTTDAASATGDDRDFLLQELHRRRYE